MQLPEFMAQIWRERVLKNTELQRKGHGNAVQEVPGSSLDEGNATDFSSPHSSEESAPQSLVGNPE